MTAAEPRLWPRYEEPGDLAAVEQTPLAERGLPASTWHLVDRAATHWPDRTAISVLAADPVTGWDTAVTLTFADLRRRVVRIAGVLTRLGVGRGDAVAVLSPNTAATVCATLAAQAVGIVAPVNPALGERRLRELVSAAGARVLICAGPDLAPEVWETVARVAPEAGVETVLLLRPDDSPAEVAAPPDLAGVRVAYLDQLAAAQDDTDLPVPPPGSTDVAAYFHTGGTTGTPRIAVHTHANEVAMAWSLAAHPNAAVGGTMFAALPLFHVNALIVTCLAPLLRGRPVLWARPLGYRDPDLYPVFWTLVERYRITAMSAVPTVYAVLAQVPVGDADISSLRAPIVGAAPLPEAVRRAFAAHTGVDLVEGYGLTEATCASAATPPGHARPGTVGQRLPYQRITAVAVDEHTGAWRDLPPGEPGLLVISGPTVFAGYLRDGTPDPSGVVRDGRLDTGDHGSVDADGFLRLTGRVKDLIIRGGHNIDPAAVEEVLLAHPDVTAAAVVGRPDRHAGEVPIAYVTLTGTTGSTTGELRAWAAERVTEPAAAPKDVIAVERIPVTAVGKVFKPELRLDAARRHLAAELAALSGRARVTTEPEGALRVHVPVGEADRVRALLDQYTLANEVIIDAEPS